MKLINLINIIILLFILCGGSYTFYLLRGNQEAQLWIGIVTAISYVLWGIIFHKIENTLHKKIVVEYILIGTIAVLVLSIILRT